jgi:NAD(P)H-dependent flavin oxidoreductase YrpB (nitropropane dioxygenase family)
MKEVIDNYSIDNYWCMDPKETIAYMAELNRPWIAYKVLAAGAIHPRAGFRHAFDNGADYVAVGMFDFQISEDAAALVEAVRDARNREREWIGGMLV